MPSVQTIPVRYSRVETVTGTFGAPAPMSNPVTFDDDDGRIRLYLPTKTPEGGLPAAPIDVTLDAIDAHDALVDLAAKHREDQDGYTPALRAWFAAKGVSGVSTLTLIRMRNAVYQRVADLLGNAQPPAPSEGPGSAASTESTAPGSPGAN